MTLTGSDAATVSNGAMNLQRGRRSENAGLGESVDDAAGLEGGLVAGSLAVTGAVD